MSKNTIHIVCGPTASGKSAKALKLAAETNGVIINCDSVQIYDGLPILTAQPTEEEKQTAPHKLYAALPPDNICSAGNWRELVEPIIEETFANKQTPIICGGSGLYIKTLMEGLSPIPDIPPKIREQAIQKQRELGNPGFHEALKKRDPVMAQRFHPGHKARLLRAWEVLEATGKSLAEWQKLPKTPPPDHWTFKVHKIMPDRDVLYERCNTRFEWMVKNGAIEEVETFSKTQDPDPKIHIPITKALGYKPLLSYLGGEISIKDAIERAQADTRQYAKRQVTWFRNQI